MARQDIANTGAMVAVGAAGGSTSIPFVRPVRSPLCGVVCAGLLATLGSMAHAVGVSGQGTWGTTLQARDLDGNPSTAQAHHDTVKNISWLADTLYGNDGSGGDLKGNAALAWATGVGCIRNPAPKEQRP